MNIKVNYSGLISRSCDSNEDLDKYLKAFVLLEYSKQEDVSSDEEKIEKIENFINNL